MVLMNGLKQQTPGRHMTGCVTHTAGAQEVREVTSAGASDDQAYR